VPSVVDAPPASEWPFRYPLCPELPSGTVVVRATHVDDAYVNAQSGTQLVTTQQAYLDAEWSAALQRHGDASLQSSPGHSEAITHPLAVAFRSADPAKRLAMCVGALQNGRTPAALVATASVCVEVNDFEAAGRDLDEAIAQAPAWAAAHYERGKLWLRRDDMVRASQSFQETVALLPGFAPAWANLGGTHSPLTPTTRRP
jgi:tetratricopeptide (TPR) repeat protein